MNNQTNCRYCFGNFEENMDLSRNFLAVADIFEGARRILPSFLYPFIMLNSRLKILYMLFSERQLRFGPFHWDQN